MTCKYVYIAFAPTADNGIARRVSVHCHVVRVP